MMSIAGRNAIEPKTLAPHEKLRELQDATQGETPSLSVYSSVNATRPAETVQGVNRAIAPFRHEPYDWQQIPPSLEDAFISLMEHDKSAA